MWAELGMSVLIIVVWVGSAPVEVGYCRVDKSSRVLTLGTTGYPVRYITNTRIVHSALKLERTLSPAGSGRAPVKSQDGLHIKSTDSGFIGLFSFPWISVGGLGGCFSIVVPLWTLFLLFAIPGARLFRRFHHTPQHCCQACGYSLTGNVSGLCPECGQGM
jgi:hypothetical protein